MNPLGERWGNLVQLSYITRDLEAAMAHCRDKLGITDFHVTSNPAPVISGGREQVLLVRAAIALVGTMQFELIEPVSGPIHHYEHVLGPNSDVINFHHVGIAVRGGFDRWQALVAALEASGDEIAFIYQPGPDEAKMVAFCYVDTRNRLGHYTEYLWWSADLNGVKAFPDLG